MGVWQVEARFAGALVHTVTQLEEAFAALRIYVVGDGRSAGGDGFRKDGNHGVEESPRPLAAQAASHGERMNARAKERFIRIDVADAAHEGLVQQQRFDARLAALEGGGELLERHLQRLGTEPRNARAETPR